MFIIAKNQLLLSAKMCLAHRYIAFDFSLTWGIANFARNFSGDRKTKYCAQRWKSGLKLQLSRCTVLFPRFLQICLPFMTRVCVCAGARASSMADSIMNRWVCSVRESRAPARCVWLGAPPAFSALCGVWLSTLPASSALCDVWLAATPASSALCAVWLGALPASSALCGVWWGCSARL